MDVDIDVDVETAVLEDYFSEIVFWLSKRTGLSNGSPSSAASISLIRLIRSAFEVSLAFASSLLTVPEPELDFAAPIW